MYVRGSLFQQGSNGSRGGWERTKGERHTWKFILCSPRELGGCREAMRDWPTGAKGGLTRLQRRGEQQKREICELWEGEADI